MSDDGMWDFIDATAERAKRELPPWKRTDADTLRAIANDIRHRSNRECLALLRGADALDAAKEPRRKSLVDELQEARRQLNDAAIDLMRAQTNAEMFKIQADYYKAKAV